VGIGIVRVEVESVPEGPVGLGQFPELELALAD
jgi:hypothetical protein